MIKLKNNCIICALKKAKDYIWWRKTEKEKERTSKGHESWMNDHNIGFDICVLYLHCLNYRTIRKIIVSRGRVWGAIKNTEYNIAANKKVWYWMDALDAGFFEKYWINKWSFRERMVMWFKVLLYDIKKAEK